MGHDFGWTVYYPNKQLPRYFELIFQYETRRLLSFGLKIKIGFRKSISNLERGVNYNILNSELHRKEIDDLLNQIFISFSYTGLAFSI